MEFRRIVSKQKPTLEWVFVPRNSILLYLGSHILKILQPGPNRISHYKCIISFHLFFSALGNKLWKTAIFKKILTALNHIRDNRQNWITCLLFYKVFPSNYEPNNHLIALVKKWWSHRVKPKTIKLYCILFGFFFFFRDINKSYTIYSYLNTTITA